MNEFLELESAFTAGKKMPKDFKIGLLLGLILISITGVLLCVSPSVSVKSRLGSLQKSKADPETEKQESSSISNKPAGSNSKRIENRSEQSQTIENKPDRSLMQEGQTKNNQLSKEHKTRFHTIRKGETLSQIAIQHYGSESQWTRIRDANPEVNVKKLQPGTTLIIPP